MHGDVFRPPRKGMLLSVFVGSGVQVLAMTVITLGIKFEEKCFILTAWSGFFNSNFFLYSSICLSWIFVAG